jgi:hypothetical protein
MINYFRPTFAVLWIFVLFVSACGDSTKKVYKGESYINYPDIYMLLRDNLESYEKSALKFSVLSIEGANKSQEELSASAMDWKDIKSIFYKANINQEKFDNKYRIDVFEDSTGTTTLTYTALDPEIPTRVFTITATKLTGNLQSIYIEYRDQGFISSEEYKLLYVNGKLIQIQEWIKKPFRSLKERKRFFTFLTS